MSTQTQDELTPTDELYHIQESTNDDGTVDVEIVEWSKEGDVVYVEYRLPTLETTSERMEWPEKDSDEYKFVRLVRHCGYTIGSLQDDEISITGCRVKFEDGETVLPEQKTRRERITEKISLSGWWMNEDGKVFDFIIVVLLWPLSGFFLSMLFTEEDEEYARGVVSMYLGVLIYVTVACIWYVF